MKTIKFKNGQILYGYKLDELEEEIRESVIEQQRDMSLEYFWGEDAINSLKGFVEHFNCTLSDYSIDFLQKGGSSVKFDIPYNMEDITEEELREYIESMGEYDKETLRGAGDCKFTGYCADDDASDGARKEYFSGERDLHEILYAGYEEWHSSVQLDYEYQLSDERIIEDIEANDYLFDEEGDMLPVLYHTNKNEIVKVTYGTKEHEVELV